jgi:hypothetical protein
MLKSRLSVGAVALFLSALAVLSHAAEPAKEKDPIAKLQEDAATQNFSAEFLRIRPLGV